MKTIYANETIYANTNHICESKPYMGMKALL